MFLGCIKQGTLEDLYQHFAIFFYLVDQYWDVVF